MRCPPDREVAGVIDGGDECFGIHTRAVDPNRMLCEIDLDMGVRTDRLNRLCDGAVTMASGPVDDLNRVHGKFLIAPSVYAEPAPMGRARTVPAGVDAQHPIG